MNFWDYFRTIWVEFLGLFWDSPDRIFRTVFGQSRTMLRFGFDLGTNVFGFIFHLGVILVGNIWMAFREPEKRIFLGSHMPLFKLWTTITFSFEL